MCSYLGALFENADADVDTALRGHLLEPYRSGQSGRTAADDNDVVFHGFARSEFLDKSVCVHLKEAIQGMVCRPSVRWKSPFPKRPLDIEMLQ